MVAMTLRLEDSTRKALRTDAFKREIHMTELVEALIRDYYGLRLTARQRQILGK